MSRRIILKNGGSLDDSMPVGDEFFEQSGTSPPFNSGQKREVEPRGVEFRAPLNEAMETAPLATELSDEATADGVEISTSGTFGDVEEGWPAPIPLGPPAPKALPVDALPPWIANYVKSVAQATQTPPDMAILHALSVLSTAVANKILVRVRGGYMERAHIWTCTILGPANRKSAVVELLSAPIHTYETELAKNTATDRRRAAEEREILERALERARKGAAGAVSAENYGDARNSVHEIADQLAALTVPAVPRLLASDVTSERLPQLMAENGGRMSMLEPEGDIFRIMAGRYTGGVNFDHYKRAWTGEPIRDDRVGREGTHVPNPALTMGLAMQPSVLETLQHARSFRGEGLLARFLFAVPRSPIGARRTGLDVPPLDEEAQRRFGQGLRTLLELEPADVDEEGWWKPHVMELSPEALQVWSGWDAEVESWLGPGGDLSGIPDWGGKLVGNTIRIAAILHAATAVECGTSPIEGPVSGETMEAAISLGRALVSHAVAVFGALDMTPEIRLARYVLDRILSAPDHANLTKRELWHRCKGKKEIQRADDLDQPLELLKEHHHLRVEGQGSTGGRPPSPAIVLNPAVLENIPKSTKSLQSAPRDGTSGTFGDVRGLCQVCGELEFLEGYCLLHWPYEAADSSGDDQ